jgi:hypothetical protein
MNYLAASFGVLNPKRNKLQLIAIDCHELQLVDKRIKILQALATAIE